MIDWQERVVEEHRELTERITKLSAFISKNSAPFQLLPEEEKMLLRRQREAMLEYHEVLGDRIARWAQ